jgi:tripartite-type tricarboxylate transporter receptor subunit TctC
MQPRKKMRQETIPIERPPVQTDQFKRRTLIGAATSIVASLISGPMSAYAATEYPNRTIKFINPFSAGSSVDSVGRLIAERLRHDWSQTIIVENRPGAGGTLGAGVVARAPADGYTLLVSVPSPITIAPYLLKNMSYDAGTDFIPVWGVLSAGLMLLVPASSPHRSVADFVRYGKANPRSIRYASAGVGSPQHLAGELFGRLTQIEMVHIPYQGAVPAMMDMLGGHVEAMFDAVSNFLPFAKEEKIRPLTILRPTRAALFPDVPTVVEAGLPAMVIPGSVGLFAAKGTTTDILTKIGDTANRVMNEPKTKQQLLEWGMTDTYVLGNDYVARVNEERLFFGRIIKDSGITLE